MYIDLHMWLSDEEIKNIAANCKQLERSKANIITSC